MNIKSRSYLFIFVGIIALFCFEFPGLGEQKMQKIQISSSAFRNGQMIPSDYTCDGDDLSPPLEWSGVPKDAKSLVLISDDPDAPMGDWVHWLIYDMPPTVTRLSEGVPSVEQLETGGVHGQTDFGTMGYGGPCPPGGVHRYFFKIYALDTLLHLRAGVTQKELLRAMKGHVLAEGELMGKYERG